MAAAAVEVGPSYIGEREREREREREESGERTNEVTNERESENAGRNWDMERKEGTKGRREPNRPSGIEAVAVLSDSVGRSVGRSVGQITTRRHSQSEATGTRRIGTRDDGRGDQFRFPRIYMTMSRERAKRAISSPSSFLQGNLLPRGPLFC